MEELSIYHLPLIGYFVFIFALLIVLPVPWKFSTAQCLFQLLAVCSLIVTWRYMLEYFRWSFYFSATQHSVDPSEWTTANWLADTSLFDEAWRWVCTGPERWWFSSQLCLFTVSTWSVFLWSQAKRGLIKNRPWAFLVLGEVVAISVSSALSLVTFTSNKNSNEGKEMQQKKTAADNDDNDNNENNNNNNNNNNNRALRWTVLSSLISVIITPTTINSSKFLPNLLAMHVFTLVLLLFVKVPKVPAPNKPLPSLFLVYVISAFISLVLQAKNTMDVINVLPQDNRTVQDLVMFLYETLFHHPAQSSISFDVVFVHLIWMVMMLIDFFVYNSLPKSLLSSLFVMLLVILSPVLSIATTLPIYLACKELHLNSSLYSKCDKDE